MPQLSIIFVPGAWHTEFHVQPVTPYLTSRGYRVVPVRLPTNRLDLEAPTLQDNVALIRKVLQTEIDAGYNVCVIGHSVSGQSCTPAVSDFLATASPAQKAQLLQVILIACFYDNMRLHENVNWYEMNWETMRAHVDDFHGTFYNDMTAEQAQPFVDALEGNLSQLPLENQSDLWRTQLPTTYLVCLKDKAIPLHLQRIEAQENTMPTVQLDMDHCPFVSRPKEFTEELLKILVTEQPTR